VKLVLRTDSVGEGEKVDVVKSMKRLVSAVRFAFWDGHASTHSHSQRASPSLSFVKGVLGMEMEAAENGPESRHDRRGADNDTSFDGKPPDDPQNRQKGASRHRDEWKI